MLWSWSNLEASLRNASRTHDQSIRHQFDKKTRSLCFVVFFFSLQGASRISVVNLEHDSFYACWRGVNTEQGLTSGRLE